MDFTQEELVILRDTMDELRDSYLENEREEDPEIWEPFEKLYDKITKMIENNKE